MIPKIIHIIWIGDETKRPDKFIRSWSKMNPEYRCALWGNKELNERKWATKNAIEKWMPREICGAADVMRWEILHKYGGIAVDADSVCVRPLEDWLLEPDFFSVWENEIARPGLIATGAMGAIKGHPFIGKIIDSIVNDPDPLSGMAWEKVGPLKLTDMVKSNSYTGITIYPSHFFIP